MNRERGLWAALVALATADAATTVVALRMGLPEFNPLVAALVDAWGLRAVPLSQVAYLVGAATVHRSIDGNRRPALMAAVGLSALVAMNNAAAIVLAGWSA